LLKFLNITVMLLQNALLLNMNMLIKITVFKFLNLAV
jgi:hypothetical protein